NAKHLVGELGELRADLQRHLDQQARTVARAHRRSVEVEIRERIARLLRRGMRVLEHELRHERRLSHAAKAPHRYRRSADEWQTAKAPLYALEERLRSGDVDKGTQAFEIVLAPEEAVGT